MSHEPSLESQALVQDLKNFHIPKSQDDWSSLPMARFIRLSKRLPPENPDNPCHIKTLMSLDDSYFIFASYHKILGRFPDSRGYNTYMEHFVTRTRTKAQIIKDLRFSQEGRAKKRRLIGFWELILKDFWHRHFRGFHLNQTVISRKKDQIKI